MGAMRNKVDKLAHLNRELYRMKLKKHEYEQRIIELSFQMRDSDDEDYFAQCRLKRAEKVEHLDKLKETWVKVWNEKVELEKEVNDYLKEGVD